MADRKMHRLQLEIPQASLDRLKRVKETTDAASYVEVIRNALRLYEALVDEAAAGTKFYVQTPGGEYVRYQMFVEG